MEGLTNGGNFTLEIVERIGFDWPTCNPTIQSNTEAFTGSVDVFPGLGVKLWSLF